MCCHIGGRKTDINTFLHVPPYVWNVKNKWCARARVKQRVRPTTSNISQRAWWKYLGAIWDRGFCCARQKVKNGGQYFVVLGSHVIEDNIVVFLFFNDVMIIKLFQSKSLNSENIISRNQFKNVSHTYACVINTHNGDPGSNSTVNKTLPKVLPSVYSNHLLWSASKDSDLMLLRMRGRSVIRGGAVWFVVLQWLPGMGHEGAIWFVVLQLLPDLEHESAPALVHRPGVYTALFPGNGSGAPTWDHILVEVHLEESLVLHLPFLAVHHGSVVHPIEVLL